MEYTLLSQPRQQELVNNVIMSSHHNQGAGSFALDANFYGHQNVKKIANLIYIYMKSLCTTCRTKLVVSLKLSKDSACTVQAFAALNKACFSCFVHKLNILHFKNTKLLIVGKMIILCMNTSFMSSHISCLYVNICCCCG